MGNTFVRMDVQRVMCLGGVMNRWDGNSFKFEFKKEFVVIQSTSRIAYPCLRGGDPSRESLRREEIRHF